MKMETKNWSTSRVLTVVTLVSLAIGAVTGLGLGYAARYEGPQQRDIYLFNNSLPFDQNKFKLPHDIFAPDRITVNRGDKLVIHYINIEDANESHTFNMGPSAGSLAPGPYDIGYSIAAGQKVNITFTANIPGVFAYVCLIHQPTMTGYLTVLG
jgi:plastocyanin